MAIPIAVLDCDLFLHGRGQRTLDRFKLEDVSDEYLLSVYGFPRQFIDYLVDLLRNTLTRPTQRSRAIAPETQILAALGFYTSGSFQTRMGDAIGISQASMSRCVSNVTEALVERAPDFISFPADEASQQRIKDVFYRLAGMLLNVEVQWPGSMQDSAIFQQSSLSRHFEEEACKEGWLLGDGVYQLQKWLLTPLHYPETTAEYRYNMAHSATHSAIEHTLGALRARFRCLDGSKGTLQYSPEKCSRIVVACCVLHNIALQHGLETWTPPAMGNQDQPEEEFEQIESLDSEAFRIRQELILNHFS
uniref:Putative nuclease HARBI1 n=1 Tax=Latimeria chalumnae TaxID=7897 RepID=H3BHK8_LATCH